jgi:hypothetical protein
MRKIWDAALLLGACMGLLVATPNTFAQSCKDEISMVEGSRQDLTAFAGTVKGENLTKFETLNHQKGAVSKLSMHDGMLGELIDCLDKAAHDATLTKEDSAAAQKLHDDAVKLQTKIKQEQHAIRAAENPQDAKTLIAGLDFAP